MTEQEENALLCSRLLGWKQLDFELFDVDGTVDGRRVAPTFLTGDGMLLLLEALRKQRVSVDIHSVPTGIPAHRWMVRPGMRDPDKLGYLKIGEYLAAELPAAVRAAALAYVRALQ